MTTIGGTLLGVLMGFALKYFNEYVGKIETSVERFEKKYTRRTEDEKSKDWEVENPEDADRVKIDFELNLYNTRDVPTGLHNIRLYSKDSYDNEILMAKNVNIFEEKYASENVEAFAGVLGEYLQQALTNTTGTIGRDQMTLITSLPPLISSSMFSYRECKTINVPPKRFISHKFRTTIKDKDKILQVSNAQMIIFRAEYPNGKPFKVILEGSPDKSS